MSPISPDFGDSEFDAEAGRIQRQYYEDMEAYWQNWQHADHMDDMMADGVPPAIAPDGNYPILDPDILDQFNEEPTQ